MPVAPEKRQLESHVAGALDAQFWSQGVQSSRSLTGVASTAPCEPQPLRLLAPGGLSRAQFLVAAQAVGVPLVPGYCGAHGGAVADRVLVQTGSRKWWGAVIGRAKAERAARQTSNSTWREVLADPNNYALAATGRLQLRRGTVLSATLQADALEQLPDSLPAALVDGWRAASDRLGRCFEKRAAGGGGDVGDAGAGATSSSSMSPPPRRVPPPRRGGSAVLRLRQALQQHPQREGAMELTAELGVNEPLLESAGGTATAPLRVSAHVGARPGARRQWLAYRAGVHGIVAPAAASNNGGGGGGAAAAAPRCAAVHLQGALALSRDAVLWQSGRKAWQVRQRPPALASAGRRRLVAAASAAAGEASPLDSVEPLSPPPSPPRSSAASAAAADVPSLAIEPLTAGGSSPAPAAASATPGSARRPLPARTPRAVAASLASSSKQQQEPPQLQLVTPAQMQDAVQGSTFWLERLRTDLQSWRGRAASGELADALGGGGAGSGGGGRGRGATRGGGGCWSAVLPAPHLRVYGLLGALGRVPLHNGGGGGSSAAGSFSDDACCSGGGGGGIVLGGGGGDSSKSLDAWRSGAAAKLRGAREYASGLGGRLAQSSSAKLFACGAASLQLGSMQRSFLDFTRLEAALDFGLTSEPVGSGVVGGGSGAGGGRLHPALALEHRGAWHALTVGATQQLFGPVRLRGEWRAALESSGAPCPAPGSLLALRGGALRELASHVAAVRPALVEAAYGADVGVPGSSGIVRLVAWWVPARREALLELRLL